MCQTQCQNKEDRYSPVLHGVSLGVGTLEGGMRTEGWTGLVRGDGQSWGERGWMGLG